MSGKEIPAKIRPHLGQMFDWEVAVKFQISQTEARRYRVDAGLDPVCKVCRKAQREGVRNTCVSDDPDARQVKLDQLGAALAPPGQAAPFDLTAELEKLEKMDAEVTRLNREVTRLLLQGLRGETGLK